MKSKNEYQEKEPQLSPFDQFCFESYLALLKDRTILLNDDIKKDVIERVVLPLTTLSKKNSKPIKLLINSNGGSIEDGQAVVDAIITSKAPVVTIAMGKAMSSAFDIFLAGSKRIVYPNTILMMHSGAARLENLTLPQINQEAELHKKYFERWSSWYSSRTNINKNDWLVMLNNGLNYYFFPEEALSKGIAHEIIQVYKNGSKKR